MKLKFFPMPANINVLNEDATYVVIDDQDRYHIATFDGTDLVITHDEEITEEIEVSFLAALPPVDDIVESFTA
jgi:hypothetical protein